MSPAKASTAPSPSTTLPQPNLRRATKLVMQLMALPGRSGQESQVARYIRDALRIAGAPTRAIRGDTTHKNSACPGECGNLILSLPGTIPGGRRLLTAHMDTVPLCVGSRPKQHNGLVRSNDPRTALGADDRAGCAVLLSAASEILECGLPHPPLTFCWFVQEEIGLFGARYVDKKLLGRPQMTINFDGGSPAKVTVGATGGYRIRIEVDGIASHAGGAPEWGVSAIAIASLAIADLHRGGWHGDIKKGKHRGTSNVGIICGGDATNVVTDRVVVRAEARSHDPTFRRRIVREIETAFEKAARAVKNVAGATGAVRFDGRLDYESFRLGDDEPCVLAAEMAVRRVGREPLRAVSNGGLDANWLTARGIPTVSLGCGQLGQHTLDEALDVADYHDACRIALCLATASEA